MHVIQRKTFLRDFLIILKRMLQNDQKILRKIVVCGSQTKDNIDFISKILKIHSKVSLINIACVSIIILLYCTTIFTRELSLFNKRHLVDTHVPHEILLKIKQDYSRQLIPCTFTYVNRDKPSFIQSLQLSITTLFSTIVNGLYQIAT